MTTLHADERTDFTTTSTPTIRALIADGHGSAVLADVPEPTPTSSQAVIAVEAVSVNRGETFLLEARAHGWRPGKDVAGTVVSAAADGTGPSVGTRVVAHAEDSGWAEQAAIGTDRIVPLADTIDFAHAAALPLAGLTALRLVRAAQLTAGTTALMTGAGGGVGHYVAELAANAGAHLTAVVRSTARGARLRELGADTILDADDAHDGFDVGMDSVGGTSLALVRRRTDPRGRVFWFGQASRTPVQLDFFDWVDGTVGAPITQFDYTVSDRSLERDLATLVDLVARGRLHPQLDRVRGFDEAARAVEDLRNRRIVGNLVLAWS